MTEHITDEEELYNQSRISVLSALQIYLTDKPDPLSDLCKYLISDSCDFFYRLPLKGMPSYNIPSGIVMAFLTGYRFLNMMDAVGRACHAKASEVGKRDLNLAYILSFTAKYLSEEDNYQLSLLSLITDLQLFLPSGIHKAVLNRELEPSDYACWILKQVEYLLHEDGKIVE